VAQTACFKKRAVIMAWLAAIIMMEHFDYS